MFNILQLKTKRPKKTLTKTLIKCSYYNVLSELCLEFFSAWKTLNVHAGGFHLRFAPNLLKYVFFYSYCFFYSYPAFPENALALWDLKGFLEWCKQRKVFAVYSRHRCIKGTIEDLWWSFYAKINHEFKRLLYEIRLCSISKSFNRSCRSSIFYKKTVLKNFIIFTKKRLQHRCFSVNNA